VIEAYVRTFVHLLRGQGKVRFIKSLQKNATLLDVGCGNDSPLICKFLRSDIYYVGLDIGDYNQNRNSINSADEYILTTPDMFPTAITNIHTTFDAVISSHNLEHCSAPNAVLDAMLRALKPGGRIYLSFPSEASIVFPKRRGLNFFDDSTHKEVVRIKGVLEQITSAGFIVDYVAEQNRPRLLNLIGLLLEPLSSFCGKVMVGTWEYYGFESIIWATKCSGR
jgi:SAM-dependent methyltransferase